MSTEPNKPDSKDPSVNIRMILAFALTGLVIFGTPYFYKLIGVQAPEQKTEQSHTQSKQGTSTPATSTPATSTPATAAAPPAPATSRSDKPLPAGTVAASAEQDVTLDTDLFHIVFSNRGAVVKSWTLKKYPDHAGKPLDLVNAAGAPKAGYPFQVELRGAKTAVDINQALFKPTVAPDGDSVTFDFSFSGVTAHKVFSFNKGSYLTKVESSLTSNGQPLPHLIGWRGGFGDMAVPNAASQASEVYYDTASDKVEREKSKAAKNGPLHKDGSFSWVGLEDQYFAVVFLPSGNGTTQTTIYDDIVKTAFNQTEDSFVGLAAGGAADNHLSVYVGPKDPDALRSLDPKLASIIDFGWFAVIAKPLFLSLRWLNDNWFHNYGWSIVIATIIINMLLFPLKFANLKSMRKMQALQPEIAKINEKYKALPLRDPRQADKNAEMMALYSKAGTNPMAGCIPMVIQMPFLFAFYKVLSVSIALRGASWLWVDDLSQPEQIAIRVLPILLVITGFIMQKMTPMATVDPAQQKTMMLMPLMMGFIFYQASSGLVLYWLTGNLVGIGQQWVLNQAMPKPEPASTVIDVKKRNNRK
jgi:YidC/Oxa1 family membrane protein insertase